MRCVLLLLLISISTEIFAQETDTWQPDSVYRVNKVKTRTVQDLSMNPWQSNLTFDTLGRIASWQLMKNDAQVQKVVYKYDDNGKLIVPSSSKYPDGKVRTEYSEGPSYERIKYFKANGQLESDIETWFERPYISNRSKGMQGGDSWDYKYKNTFKRGLLVKRECFKGKKIIQTMLYQYDVKGLLIQKSTLSDVHPPIIEDFLYTFR